MPLSCLKGTDVVKSSARGMVKAVSDVSLGHGKGAVAEWFQKPLKTDFDTIWYYLILFRRIANRCYLKKIILGDFM